MRRHPMFEPTGRCEDEWTRSRLQPVLSGDEVHLWRTPLEPPFESVHSLGRILSDGERRRADRFAFEEHRSRYVVAHGLSRIILGRYLDLAPERLKFSQNRYGKPALECRWGGDLRFNLSFSGAIGVLAVTRGREVGVDVECVRPFPAADQIVRRYFSNQEKEAYFDLQEEARETAFFCSWVRKEAYVKARGKGLSLPLSAFSVPVHPEDPATLVHREDAEHSDSGWFLRDVLPIDGYAAALAVEEGQGLRFCHWLWSF